MIIIIHTVDGRNPAPVEVGSLSHYLQGFYTSKLWLFGISEPSTVPSVQKLLASAAHFAGWGLYRSFLLGGKKVVNTFHQCAPEPRTEPSTSSTFLCRLWMFTNNWQANPLWIVNFLSLQQHFRSFLPSKRKQTSGCQPSFFQWLLLYLLGTLCFKQVSWATTSSFAEIAFAEIAVNCWHGMEPVEIFITKPCKQDFHLSCDFGGHPFFEESSRLMGQVARF